MNLKTAFFTALLSVALASPAVADTSRGGNSHHRNSSGISISFGHGLEKLFYGHGRKDPYYDKKYYNKKHYTRKHHDRRHYEQKHYTRKHHDRKHYNRSHLKHNRRAHLKRSHQKHRHLKTNTHKKFFKKHHNRRYR